MASKKANHRMSYWSCDHDKEGSTVFETNPLQSQESPDTKIVTMTSEFLSSGS